MYQCFHCLSDGVCWDGDFTFEDYGLEGEGLIHVCHCSNCGAEIEAGDSSQVVGEEKQNVD